MTLVLKSIHKNTGKYSHCIRISIHINHQAPDPHTKQLNICTMILALKSSKEDAGKPLLPAAVPAHQYLHTNQLMKDVMGLVLRSSYKDAGKPMSITLSLNPLGILDPDPTRVPACQSDMPYSKSHMMESN